MTLEKERRCGPIARLAICGCLGVFIAGALSNCDGGPSGDNDAQGRDFLCVAACEYVQPAFQKYDVKTGGFVPGFAPDYPCISADVDNEKGRIFVYTYDYLRSYANDGRLLRERRVQTHRESGREYIAFNSRDRTLYFLDGRGWITVFNAEGLDVADRFDTPMADAHQFYMEEGAAYVWMVSKDRHEIRGYRTSKRRVVAWVTTDGKFWQLAFEPWTRTIIVGLTKNDGNFLYRFGDYLYKEEKLPVDIVPRYVAVEPGSGTLWVSDGKATARYAPDGEKLAGLPGLGFKYLVFNYNGHAAFAVDPEGRFYAVHTRDLRPIWSARRFSPQHDIHMLKYSTR